MWPEMDMPQCLHLARTEPVAPGGTSKWVRISSNLVCQRYKSEVLVQMMMSLYILVPYLINSRQNMWIEAGPGLPGPHLSKINEAGPACCGDLSQHYEAGPAPHLSQAWWNLSRAFWSLSKAGPVLEWHVQLRSLRYSGCFNLWKIISEVAPAFYGLPADRA